MQRRLLCPDFLLLPAEGLAGIIEALTNLVGALIGAPPDITAIVLGLLLVITGSFIQPIA